MPTAKEPQILYVPEVEHRKIEVHLLGQTPLICNRMSQKALHELLMPRGRMNSVERQANLKHDPLSEYRASPYTLDDPAAPTYLAVMASAIKSAMATAALDLPGITKAQIGRRVWVEGHYLPIYGLPQLSMTVTRSADINHTPDVRTRAIIPSWACSVTVSYIQSMVTAESIINLLTTGGLTCGIGDWRPEKGSGTFGQFAPVDESNPEFQRIRETGGRAAQQRALEIDDPVFYDAESIELFSWYGEEIKVRRRRGSVATARSVA